MATTQYKRFALAAMITILAFVMGVLIGYFSRRINVISSTTQTENDDLLNKLSRSDDSIITQKLLDSIDVKHFEKVLKDLTATPRLAGTESQRKSAEYVHNLFIESGLTSKIVTYDVLLSYPLERYNNTVSVIESGGLEVYKSTPYEELTEEFDKRLPSELPAFHGFSPSGDVTADVVYANYGRLEDFEKLLELGIDCTGKIVIARYGKIFRGNKVHFAYQAGAVGVILYSDPNDYGPQDDHATGPLSSTYPDGIWLPDTGIQRGNIALHKGDQATPDYPALWYTQRLTKEELEKKLPKIPSQPVGYRDAFAILSNMEGNEAPESWRGGLNVTYRLGYKLKLNRKVRMMIKNEYKYVPIHNVVGKIQGQIEPDRYVVFGNHRDTWQYGGLDATSGSIVLQEVARIFGNLAKNGWRPRRSILFCSWDAEEYGLVGSYEWVEDNLVWLKSSAVAYINTDTSVAGNASFMLKTVPLLKQVFFESAKMVKDPRDNTKSVFEVWKGQNEKPRTLRIGAGSDHVPFIATAGIPSLYAKFYGFENWFFSSSSPLYHSRFETYRAVKMIDPEFKFSKAMTGILAECCRRLADQLLLPQRVSDYVDDIQESVTKVTRFLHDKVDDKYIDGIERALSNFTEAAQVLAENIQNVDRKNPLAVRAINDRIMTLERAFLDVNGIPYRTRYKHILHSPSSTDYYAGAGFPGADDLIKRWMINKNAKTLRELEQHLSVIAYSIFSAAKAILN